MSGKAEISMSRNLSRLFLRIAFISTLALAGSCDQGDRKGPGEIDDLAFLWDAAALSEKDGRVFINNQTWPPNTRSLALTATGDNEDEGEASQYDLRYFSQYELKEKNFEDDWDDAHRIFNESQPSKAGEIDVLFLPRMTASSRYYFALKAKDEIGQVSEISNIVGPVAVPLLSIQVLSARGNLFRLPAALAMVGDVNIDEYPDLAVGDPLSGKVLVHYGMDEDDLLFKKKIEGADVHRAKETWLPQLIFKGDPAESFGAAVAGVGFVNLGNYPDILVGAPDAQAQAGRAYLFYTSNGMESPILADSANSVFTGDNPGDMFGSAVTACMDLNNDGYGDFAVSSPASGTVYVFLGGSKESSRGRLPSSANASAAAALVIYGEAVGDEFGSALDCGLDINGDGLPDLVVSAPENQGMGAVYIFYGGNAGMVNFTFALKDPGSQKVIDLAVKDADVTIRGTVAGARFGHAVRLAGNLYGRDEEKSTSDLAASAPGLDPPEVLVFYGGDAGNIIFPGEITSPLEAQDTKRDIALTGETGQGFGTSLAGGWDLNNDDSDDLVVGLPDAGKAVIYFWDRTKSPESIPKYSITHPDPASRFGEVILALPDFNLDDKADLLISATQEGKVYFEF